jgi:hypothetical protein
MGLSFPSADVSSSRLCLQYLRLENGSLSPHEHGSENVQRSTAVMLRSGPRQSWKEKQRLE